MATQKSLRQPAEKRELPHAIELEQLVLGSILVNNTVFSSISPILEAKHFCEEIHVDIFEAVSALIMRGASANPVAVKMQMRNGGATIQGISMGQYLSKLAANGGGSIMAISAAPQIKETYLRRCLISAGESMVEVGYQISDTAELVEEIGAGNQFIADIASDLTGKSAFYGASIADEYLSMITKESAATTTGDPTKRAGIPICLPEIATVLSEKMLQPKHLYGMLSSSGEGKTSMMLQIVYRALAEDNPVLLLSYDQTGPECVAQMVAQQYGYEVRRQKMGDLHEKEIDRAYQMARQIGAMRFQVIDCDSTKDTAARLAAYARTFVKRNLNGRTPLILIDHIGTIRPDIHDMKSDEGTKARNIGQQLKSLAKELNAAVMVLQQRSGSGMKRANPRPIPADLYGGEAARQPFDAIFYLYRAELHMQQQLDVAQDEREAEKIRNRFQQQFGATENVAEIGALKVRFGSRTIRRKVEFAAQFTRYVSLAPVDAQEGFF